MRTKLFLESTQNQHCFNVEIYRWINVDKLTLNQRGYHVDWRRDVISTYINVESTLSVCWEFVAWVYHGGKSIPYIGTKIWDIVSPEVEKINSLNGFIIWVNEHICMECYLISYYCYCYWCRQKSYQHLYYHWSTLCYFYSSAVLKLEIHPIF